MIDFLKILSYHILEKFGRIKLNKFLPSAIMKIRVDWEDKCHFKVRVSKSTSILYEGLCLHLSFVANSFSPFNFINNPNPCHVCEMNLTN